MALTVEVDRLKRIPLFSGVDLGKLKLLAFAGETIPCAKEDVIFRQNEPSDSVYIVLDGEVGVWRQSGDSHVLLARLGPGQIFGEIGVLCDRTRTATVNAISDGQLLRIEKSVFLEFTRELPDLALSIIRELGARLDNMNQQLARATAR
jgi:CRP-like cAMP-binding protein